MNKKPLLLNGLFQLGSFISFTLRVLSRVPLLPGRFFEFSKQLKKMGYDSILLITVTSGFTGLVTAVQASYQTRGYIPKNLIGVMVAKSTMTELAPVLTALVLSGKIGAAIAAEIGTMKVSEQIDAMKSMGVDPDDYLYLPRIIAGIIVLPLLTIYANFVGIVSAFFVANLKYNVNVYTFFINMKNYFRPLDLWGGLVKAFFFGLIITSIACYTGSNTKGGAEGVGKATTLTVVYSSILILLMDFLVAAFLFGGY
jgi:phospholipid/cholesterol/gamma-HCH transport system permease protein